uniref:Uncharacterized protein n=1 Tax=Arundo donax TaxID=35708 RepID=A0A0A9CA84_ARUDO
MVGKLVTDKSDCFVLSVTLYHAYPIEHCLVDHGSLLGLHAMDISLMIGMGLV